VKRIDDIIEVTLRQICRTDNEFSQKQKFKRDDKPVRIGYFPVSKAALDGVQMG
jgi:hypothetical protein